MRVPKNYKVVRVPNDTDDMVVVFYKSCFIGISRLEYALLLIVNHQRKMFKKVS